jgi:hypothetical protein
MMFDYYFGKKSNPTSGAKETPKTETPKTETPKTEAPKVEESFLNIWNTKGNATSNQIRTLNSLKPHIDSAKFNNLKNIQNNWKNATPQEKELFIREVSEARLKQQTKLKEENLEKIRKKAESKGTESSTKEKTKGKPKKE